MCVRGSVASRESQGMVTSTESLRYQHQQSPSSTESLRYQHQQSQSIPLRIHQQSPCDTSIKRVSPYHQASQSIALRMHRHTDQRMHGHTTLKPMHRHTHELPSIITVRCCPLSSHHTVAGQDCDRQDKR